MSPNFEAVYNAHQHQVFNLALQYVQNIEDAEEITQDVFLSVSQSLSSFREDAKMTTWLYRITINKSLDFIKSKRAKKRFGFLTSLFFNESSEIKNTFSNFDHPGVLLENKEALAKLFSHINTLNDNQKTVLILSKIEGKSQIEIAEIMAISSKAVESLLQRAKQNLKNKIDQNEGI